MSNGDGARDGRAEPGASGPSEHTPVRGRGANESARRARGRAGLAVVLLAPLVFGACRTRPASSPGEADGIAASALESHLRGLRATPPAGGLRIRLAFGAGADLDLFVTDPHFDETVYFANSPSRAGGVATRDDRCGDPEPRIDEITFPAPPPGRYRVGVDYHAACTDAAASAPFVVEIEYAGGRTLERGFLQPGQFLSRFSEFELEGPASADGQPPRR